MYVLNVSDPIFCGGLRGRGSGCVLSMCGGGCCSGSVLGEVMCYWKFSCEHQLARMSCAVFGVQCMLSG